MRLLFVYDHKYPQLWLDGLSAALNTLEQKWVIEKINLQDFKEMESGQFYLEKKVNERGRECDFTLGWGAFNSPVDNLLKGLKIKKGLCIAGNAFPPTECLQYDALFYETKWYRPQIEHHPHIFQAFGVNTDIFFQVESYPVPILWDYIGVGSFSYWKRWEKMTHKTGRKLIIGEYQKDNEEESGRIVKHLLKNGVMVSDMVNPFDLSLLYNSSRVLYLPSDINGGGERAVLEARSCGLTVECEDDNPKLKELINLEKIPTHLDYANCLERGITTVLKGGDRT